jgi:hypothetical protein
MTLLPLLLAVPAGQASAQPSKPFERVMDAAREHDWKALPLGAIVQRVGEQFLGAPYEGGLLDRSAEETLHTGLDRFDCVLFVESALALARGIAEGDFGHDAFARRIEEQRYRDGKRDGYCSRLHYFTEWIRDNERRGTVRDITREIGGEALPRRLDFMGRHRDSYPLLADDSLYAGILEMEERLGDHVFHHVPASRIRSVYPLLEAGDIVAFVTRVEGLDVSHTGLVYDAGDGGRGVLHASLDRGVIISPDLQAFVEGNRSQTGIVIARPVDHRDDAP